MGGLATSYFQLLLSRTALGASESPAFPGAVRVTSDWFHVKDRGRPTGVYNSGGSIGPAIAPPLLTAIMLMFDWRVMFITMGVVGIAGAGIWFLIYRDPAKTKLEPVDEAYLAENRAGTNKVEARQWMRLFRFRSMWGLTLGAFCSGYAVWMYQTWLPAYLEMQQHISIKNTGYLASIPLICSILGAWSGGYVCDRLAAGGTELVASRRIPAIVGLVLSGVFTYAATAAMSATPAVILISCAMYFLSFGIAGKWTMITAVAPQSYCTSVASLQNFGGYLGGHGLTLDHRICGGYDRVVHGRADDRSGRHGCWGGAAVLPGADADRGGGVGGSANPGFGRVGGAPAFLICSLTRRELKPRGKPAFTVPPRLGDDPALASAIG